MFSCCIESETSLKDYQKFLKLYHKPISLPDFGLPFGSSCEAIYD